MLENAPKDFPLMPPSKSLVAIRIADIVLTVLKINGSRNTSS